MDGGRKCRWEEGLDCGKKLFLNEIEIFANEFVWEFLGITKAVSRTEANNVLEQSDYEFGRKVNIDFLLRLMEVGGPRLSHKRHYKHRPRRAKAIHTST